MSAYADLAAYVQSHPAQYAAPDDEDRDMFDALPPELGPLYAATWGCEIDFPDGSFVLAIDDVLDLLEQPELFEELPGLLPFAQRDDRWALVDTLGTLGAAGSVWDCPQSDLSRHAARPLADSVEALVESLLRSR